MTEDRSRSNVPRYLKVPRYLGSSPVQPINFKKKFKAFIRNTLIKLMIMKDVYRYRLVLYPFRRIIKYLRKV